MKSRAYLMLLATLMGMSGTLFVVANRDFSKLQGKVDTSSLEQLSKSKYAGVVKPSRKQLQKQLLQKQLMQQAVKRKG